MAILCFERHEIIEALSGSGLVALLVRTVPYFVPYQERSLLGLLISLRTTLQYSTNVGTYQSRHVGFRGIVYRRHFTSDYS
jgi:hypothetical protein